MDNRARGRDEALLRKLRENLEILDGKRGAERNRAVRVHELENFASGPLAGFLSQINAQIEKKITQSGYDDDDIRRLIDDGRKKAEAAAERVGKVQTKLTDLNAYLDNELAGLQDDFADARALVEADLIAIGNTIDQTTQGINDQIADLQTEMNDDLAAVSQAISDAAAATTQAFADARAQVEQDLAGVYDDIAELSGSVEERIAAEVPRITSIERQIDDARDLILKNTATLELLGKRVTDAGIHVDAETGSVEIYAVKALEQTVGDVSIALDAATASINLRATYAYVNEAVSNAVLDPTQIPILEDFGLRLGEAEIAISGLEAEILLKATQIEVEGISTTVSTVVADLDAAEAAIALRATQAEMDDTVGRVSAAEAIIDAQSGILLTVQSVVGEYRAFEDLSFENLQALLDAYRDRELLREQIATASFQIKTDIVDGLSAEAASRLALQAEMENSVSLLYQENTARASENESLALSLTGLISRVDDVETGYVSLAYAGETFYTKATTDEAIALSEETLSTEFADAISAFSETVYTKAEVDSAFAALEQSLSAEIDDDISFFAQTVYTKAEMDRALSLFGLQLTSSLGEIREIEDFGFANLQALLDTLRDRDRLRGQIANISFQLRTEITDGISSEAFARLALRAEMENSVADLVQSNLTRATEIEALSSSLNSWVAVVENIEDDYVNAAYVQNYTYAKADLEEAVASMITTGEVSVGDALASWRTDMYIRADFESAVATLIEETEITVGGALSSWRNVMFQSVEFDSAVASLITNVESAVGDAMATYLTQMYQDVGLDSAIAGLITTVGTEVEQAMADFREDIFTSSDLDAAIVAFMVDQEAAFGSALSQRFTNYYTKAQADSAIASATSTLRSAMEGEGGSIYLISEGLADLEGLIEDEYLTKVDTEGAIAGVERTIRAKIDRAAPPSDFVDGSIHWQGALTGSPDLDDDARTPPSASWTFADNVAHIVTSGSGYTDLIASRGAVAVSEADVIRVTVRAKITGTGSGIGSVRGQVAWLDGAFSTSTITQEAENKTLAPGADYATLVFEFTAPADALWARAVVRFSGANLASGAVCELQIVRIENVSAVRELGALITQGYYTKVDADQAIAGAISDYDAQIEGGVAARVSENIIALSGLNGSVARLTQKVSTGSGWNAAGIEFFAWDDESGTGTAVRLLGDEVIVPGSLTAGTLLVTDGSGELIPNRNFLLGDLSGWTIANGAESDVSVVEKVAGEPGLSTANAAYAVKMVDNNTASVTTVRLDSSPIACKESERIAYGVEAALGGTAPNGRAGVFVRFFDKDDTLLDGAQGAWVDVPSTTWETLEGVAVVPENAVYFRTRLNLEAPASVPIYATNVGSLKQRSGAILITPHSITGAQLITSEEIITNTAQIAEAIIGNAQLLGDIWSDNFAVDGEGYPISGFKLKRDTGQILGVEVIARELIVKGAATDFVPVKVDGELDPSTYTSTWVNLLQITLGETALGEMWSVCAGADFRQWVYIQDPLDPTSPYYRRRARTRLIRELKKTPGGEWGPAKEIGGIQVATEDDWKDVTFAQSYGGKYADVRYTLQVDVTNEGIVTPPSYPANHRDLFLTAQRNAR